MSSRLVSMLLSFCSLCAFSSAWGASPVFTSGPYVSANPALTGQKLTVTAVASEPGAALTYTYRLGDGTVQTTTATSVDHVYVLRGLYGIDVSVSDGTNTTSGQTIFLSVNEPATEPPVGNGVDTDGDGFSDLFEMSIGTDPYNNASTPFGAQTITAADVYKMSVTKAKITLHFDKKGSSEIKMSGIITAPQGFTSANATFIASVGGYALPFKLNASGKGTLGKSSMSISTKGSPISKARAAREGFIVGPGVMMYTWNVDMKESQKQSDLPPPQPYPFEPPADQPQIPDFVPTVGDMLNFMAEFGLIDDDVGYSVGKYFPEIIPLPIALMCPECFFDIVDDIAYSAHKGKTGSGVPPPPSK
ncbi:MAG TPA: PKD domain-containing protein [Planctomycetota bacterium]|nr:PKD domain-containing protein [Planctomycetota bacterium]